jgi:hypothetical protein
VDELKPTLKSKFLPETSLKEINDKYVNKARNFFKHRVCELEEMHEFDTETEAICALVRASYNAALVTNEIPEPIGQFYRWLKERRPELLNYELD